MKTTKELTIGQQTLTYTLRRRSRVRRLRLSISRQGEVSVTIPVGFFQERVAEKFIKEKSVWIIKKLEQIKKIQNEQGSQLTTKDYESNKKKAGIFVQSRIKELNNFYRFTYNVITMRNQKTRWGSCSRNKNLHFSYKLLFLPPRLADYIIVHELCHLKEMNHSKKFWDLVARKFPDHKALRKELQVQSIRLG